MNLNGAPGMRPCMTQVTDDGKVHFALDTLIKQNEKKVFLICNALTIHPSKVRILACSFIILCYYSVYNKDR